MADEEEVWTGEDGYATLGLGQETGVPEPFGSGLIDVNPRAYSKYPLERLVTAAHDGDLQLLEKMLDREDPVSGYHADISAFTANGVNALHAAAVNGQTEAVEMLLRAGADPHVRASVAQGDNPRDGETARDMADKWGWDDVAEMLKKAEDSTKKGVYLPYGPGNNAKLWPIDRPQGLDPAQEKRAMKRYKGLVRPLPTKTTRKFYGDLVYGITHGLDESGNPVRPGARRLLSQQEDESQVEPWKGPSETHTSAPSQSLSVVPGVGLLFPGQGAQYAGMLEDVQGLPKVREMLATAEKVLGFDLLNLCLNGPATKLEQPEVCFPAVYIGGLAAMEKLREQRPEVAEQPGAVAGLGIGEYTALTVAGVFGFETGLELVKSLGEAVAQFSEETAQATLSVAGLDKAALATLCQSVGDGCGISQELFPKGFTCGGTAAACEQLQELANKSGALQTKVVKAYGAIFSSLMGPVEKKLRRTARAALPKMKPAECDVYMNITGKAVRRGTPPSEIVELMCGQVTGPLLWQSCVSGMIAAGIDEFYEVGPMKQLKAMMKRIDGASWSKTANIEV